MSTTKPDSWRSVRRFTATKICAQCHKVFGPGKIQEKKWKKQIFCSMKCGMDSRSKTTPDSSLRPSQRTSVLRFDPVEYRPLQRTPDSAYARCEECGTDAGEPCYDSSDRPCPPCAGRVLASIGADLRDAGKKKAQQKPAPAPKAKPPKAVPVLVARCACGRPARDGATCGRRICRPPLRCHWCDVEVPQRGRRPGVIARCLARACQLACKRSWQADQRSKVSPDPASQSREK